MFASRVFSVIAGCLEVVSKPQIRSKGKAQTERESAAYMGVCEHLPEACAAPWFIESDANPALRGNAVIGPQMGF
jgi:hypothetical protein